jgi:hypothetical protein
MRLCLRGSFSAPRQVPSAFRLSHWKNEKKIGFSGPFGVVLKAMMRYMIPNQNRPDFSLV